MIVIGCNHLETMNSLKLSLGESPGKIPNSCKPIHNSSILNLYRSMHHKATQQFWFRLEVFPQTPSLYTPPALQ